MSMDRGEMKQLTTWKDGKLVPCNLSEFIEGLRAHAEWANGEFSHRSSPAAHLSQRLNAAADALAVLRASAAPEEGKCAALPRATEDGGRGIAERNSLVLIRNAIVMAIAFLGRDAGSKRSETTTPQIIEGLSNADAEVRRCIDALSPSPSVGTGTQAVPSAQSKDAAQ